MRLCCPADEFSANLVLTADLKLAACNLLRVRARIARILSSSLRTRYLDAEPFDRARVRIAGDSSAWAVAVDQGPRCFGPSRARIARASQRGLRRTGLESPAARWNPVGCELDQLLTAQARSPRFSPLCRLLAGGLLGLLGCSCGTDSGLNDEDSESQQPAVGPLGRSYEQGSGLCCEPPTLWAFRPT
jgi:hypothetical protein